VFSLVIFLTSERAKTVPLQNSTTEKQNPIFIDSASRPVSERKLKNSKEIESSHKLFLCFFLSFYYNICNPASTRVSNSAKKLLNPSVKECGRRYGVFVLWCKRVQCLVMD
jgi:hypothetical protein